MSLFIFLLSSRHHFQCAGNVHCVRDDGSLHPEKNLSSSSPEQFPHSLVYLSGPPSNVNYDNVILLNVISRELLLEFPSEGGHTWWYSLLVSFLRSPPRAAYFYRKNSLLLVIYKSRIHSSASLAHLLQRLEYPNMLGPRVTR